MSRHFISKSIALFHEKKASMHQFIQLYISSSTQIPSEMTYDLNCVVDFYGASFSKGTNGNTSCVFVEKGDLR